MGPLDANTTILDVLRAKADDLATPRRSLKRKFHDKPLLGTERPMRAVLRDLVIIPGVMPLALGQLNAGDPIGWIVARISLVQRHHISPQIVLIAALRRWFLDCREHLHNVFALKKRDTLFAVLRTETFNDSAARLLRFICERMPLIRSIIHHN